MCSQFFQNFEIKFYCFVEAMSDLVLNLEAIHGLRELLAISGNIFLNMIDARESANCSFTGILHISEKISRCC